MPRVTFLHPDLGIGGAERLVLDAALGLKNHGHTVNIVTTHYDRNRAFEETLNEEISITVVGDWIPRSIFNRFYALMAYVRMIYAAFYIVFFSDCNPDVCFCDLVSVAVPILKLKIQNVIFYCHFPDQLLSKPGGLLKSFYRKPLNYLEEYSTEKASLIFVNSEFTANIFKKTFRKINKTPAILYPSLNMKFFDSFDDNFVLSYPNDIIKEDTFCFVSINRYERKKNLSLALKALSELKNLIDEAKWAKVHLVMAGGYDSRVVENVEYFEELNHLKVDLDLNDKVTFLRSIADYEKISLLKLCICLLYTPSNEHFGITPLEAMYMSKPIIAVNSGGPTETIVNGQTGYLCDPNPSAFAEAMSKIVLNRNVSEKFGAAGKKRIISLFSFDQFSNKLNDALNELLVKKKS